MEKALRVLGLYLVATLFVFAVSCELYTFDQQSLVNKTLTYRGSSSEQIFAFDGSGRAGTFTTVSYQYAYGSVEDYTSQDASKKLRRQTSGSKGSFTYDPTNHVLVRTYAQKWGPSNSAVDVGDGTFTAYEWLSLDEYYSGSLTQNRTEVATQTAVFTTDNFETFNAYKQSGDTWVYSYEAVGSYLHLPSGQQYTSTFRDITKYSISANVINIDYETGTSITNGATTTSSTFISKTKKDVLDWYVMGETSENEDFTWYWTNGKKLSFLVSTSHYEEQSYTSGQTPASPPTIFTDGLGYSGPSGSYYAMVTPYYRINKNPQSPTVTTFAHRGSYMLQNFDGAARFFQ